MNVMKGAILDLVYDNGEVTFGQLDREVPGFEDRGEQGGCLTMPDNENCVLWVAVSPDAAAALKQLLAEGLIRIASTSPWTYLSRNEGLDLPVAEHGPAEPYDEPTWLPVTIRANVTFEGRMAS